MPSQLAYPADGLNMHNQLVLPYDGNNITQRPGGLIFPEASGLSDQVKGRSKRLAELGYHSRL